MTESTNSTAQRVTFTDTEGAKVKLSALIDAAKGAAIIGRASTSASKVLALAAILTGGGTEDVAKRTGIAQSQLARIAGIARNGFKPLTDTDDRATASPADIVGRMRAIDWAALTGDPGSNAWLDASYDAAAIWDDVFAEKAAKRDPKTETLTPTDLAILVHDNIVNAEDPQVWITAVEDALASALASLEEAAAA